MRSALSLLLMDSSSCRSLTLSTNPPINEGLIFIAIATFFGSIGSFLYVFRPLAALFLGQELPQFKKTIKEAPVLMLIPMLILSLLNIFTGVYAL